MSTKRGNFHRRPLPAHKHPQRPILGNVATWMANGGERPAVRLAMPHRPATRQPLTAATAEGCLDRHLCSAMPSPIALPHCRGSMWTHTCLSAQLECGLHEGACLAVLSSG